MAKQGIKKTGIRMTDEMWDEIVEVSSRYGMTANAYMVSAIGEKLVAERNKYFLQSAEGMAEVLNKINPDLLKMIQNNSK